MQTRSSDENYVRPSVRPTVKHLICDKMEQDAQLSQRDRAAGCVIVSAKSRTLELGEVYL